MKRKEAVTACWDLVNKGRYTEAQELFKAQTRVHGRRVFGYRLRLCIVNGVWEQSLDA